jgi:hypothetical protein
MDTTGIISIRMASKSLPATTIEYKHNANHQRRASSRGERLRNGNSVQMERFDAYVTPLYQVILALPLCRKSKQIFKSISSESTYLIKHYSIIYRLH